YTFTTISSSDGSAAPSLTNGLPRHHGAIQVSSQISPRLQAAALFSATTSYLVPLFDAVTFASGSYRFDGTRRLDLCVRYRVFVRSGYRVSVIGRIDNVTDQMYFERGFRTPGRVAALGFGVEF